MHSIRDALGGVLGLGPRGGEIEGDGQQNQDDYWQPVTDVWIEHEEAVTGMDVVAGYGDGGDVSTLLTSGGDG